MLLGLFSLQLSIFSFFCTFSILIIIYSGDFLFWLSICGVLYASWTWLASSFSSKGNVIYNFVKIFIFSFELCLLLPLFLYFFDLKFYGVPDSLDVLCLSFLDITIFIDCGTHIFHFLCLQFLRIFLFSVYSIQLAQIASDNPVWVSKISFSDFSQVFYFSDFISTFRSSTAFIQFLLLLA